MFHFLLILMLFLFLTLIKNKTLNFIFLILGSIFVLVEFVAHHVLRIPLNIYSWYYINLESFEIALKNFKLEIFVFTISTIVATVLMYFLVKYYNILINKLSQLYNKNIKNISKVTCLLLLCLTVFLLEREYKLFYSLYEIYGSQQISENTKIQDILKKYNVENEIRDRDKIEATSGKNIVILLLESTENGYFDKNIYPDIMPYLSSLKDNKNWTFSDKLREPGFASFGSFYTLLTGMPYSPIFEHNSMMKSISKVEMTSIGDILNAAEYNQEAILSSKFAGTDRLLEIFNIRYLIDKEDYNNNGIYDIIDNSWGGTKIKICLI